MKFLSLSLVALLLLSSCAKEEVKTETAKQTEANANITLASISVPQMQCEMCEETITTAATSVAGVTAVKANAATDKADVSFDKTKTDLASIEKAIAKVGYTANGAVRDSAAYDNLPSCCKEQAAK